MQLDSSDTNVPSGTGTKFKEQIIIQTFQLTAEQQELITQSHLTLAKHLLSSAEGKNILKY